jgi:hypothetical protein
MTKIEEDMPGETVPKIEKSDEVCSMRKQVQKKTDGRTIIFYSFVTSSAPKCEAKSVTELNTSKLEG